jgi:hypothetical protein
MYTVKIRPPGAVVSLMLVAVMVLAFAAAATAQTPADDQYGSPTDPAVTAGGGVAADTGSGGDVASGTTGGGGTSKAGEASGGVLPSTGGAPISLLLAGTILVGGAVTLRLGHRAGS